MKRQSWILVFCLLILAIVCLLLWLYHPLVREEANSRKSVTTVTNQSLPSDQSTQPPVLTGKASSTSSPLIHFNAESNREATLKRSQEEWKTPIIFYGKVVDENTNPVAGAHIDFDWNNLSGTQNFHAESDANGLFSVSGIQGLVLGVKVSKVGYYRPTNCFS